MTPQPTIEEVLHDQVIFKESVKEYPFEENNKSWVCSNNTIADYCRSSFQHGARFAKQAMTEYSQLTSAPLIKEIERVKELLEQEYKSTKLAKYFSNPNLTFDTTHEYAERDWQQFKTQNNL